MISFNKNEKRMKLPLVSIIVQAYYEEKIIKRNLSEQYA